MPDLGDTLVADIQGDIKQYFDDLGVEIDKSLVIALIQATKHAEGELKQAIMDLFSHGGTGALADNPKATLLQTDGAVKSAGAFLDLVYARIQDEGGEIRAKSVKNLAIPLTDEARTPGKWPRTWAPGSLFFLKSKRGNKLLVSRKGAKDFTPQYLLKPSVRIRGKGYVERARRAAEKVIAEIIGDHVSLTIANTPMPKGSE